MILTYLIIIFYIFLFITFKKKAAASRSLHKDQRTEGRGRRTCLERKFIVVNFFLVAILFLCSQPVTILGIVSFYSNEDPNSSEFLIASLIVENVFTWNSCWTRLCTHGEFPNIVRRSRLFCAGTTVRIRSLAEGQCSVIAPLLS